MYARVAPWRRVGGESRVRGETDTARKARAHVWSCDVTRVCGVVLTAQPRRTSHVEVHTCSASGGMLKGPIYNFRECSK